MCTGENMGHLGDNKLISQRDISQDSSLREDPMSGQRLLENVLSGQICRAQGPAGHQGNLYFKNRMCIHRHGGLNSKRFSSNKKSAVYRLSLLLPLAFCRKWEHPADGERWQGHSKNSSRFTEGRMPPLLPNPRRSHYTRTPLFSHSQKTQRQALWGPQHSPHTN